MGDVVKVTKIDSLTLRNSYLQGWEDRCPGNEADYHMPRVKSYGSAEESQTDFIWDEKHSLGRVRTLSSGGRREFTKMRLRRTVVLPINNFLLQYL